jgi:hypothetical protein
MNSRLATAIVLAACLAAGARCSSDSTGGKGGSGGASAGGRGGAQAGGTSGGGRGGAQAGGTSGGGRGGAQAGGTSGGGRGGSGGQGGSGTSGCIAGSCPTGQVCVHYVNPPGRATYSMCRQDPCAAASMPLSCDCAMSVCDGAPGCSAGTGELNCIFSFGGP